MGNMQIQIFFFFWVVVVRFADPLSLSALKQTYFVGKHKNLLLEKSNCPLQEPVARGRRGVQQSLSKK